MCVCDCGSARISASQTDVARTARTASTASTTIMSRQTVQTKNAPATGTHLSHATIHNGVVYCSGALPIDPVTNELVGGTIGDRTVSRYSVVRGPFPSSPLLIPFPPDPLPQEPRGHPDRGWLQPGQSPEGQHLCHQHQGCPRRKRGLHLAFLRAAPCM